MHAAPAGPPDLAIAPVRRRPARGLLTGISAGEMGAPEDGNHFSVS